MYYYHYLVSFILLQVEWKILLLPIWGSITFGAVTILTFSIGTNYGIL